MRPSSSLAVRPLTLALAGTLGSTPAAFAQPAAEPALSSKTDAATADSKEPATAGQPLTPASDFRLELTAWIWIVGMSGNIGVGDRTADVNAGFGDILEASDSVFAFSGRLEIGVGRWGGFLDGMYSDLGVDDQTGPLGVADVDVNVEMALVSFGAMYRVGDWEPSGDAAANPHRITLDLYAGARYTNLDVRLEPATLAARSRGVDWFDPIVGAKFVLPFSQQWHMEASGDIGGFGVGSDFTWSATAVFGYDFTLFDHPAAVFLGYRAIGQDYTEGSGADRFEWDIVQHGPILGFSMRF